MEKVQISTLTIKEIKRRLMELGQETGGNKAELVIRLASVIGGDEIIRDADKVDQDVDDKIEKLTQEVSVLKEMLEKAITGIVGSRTEVNQMKELPTIQVDITEDSHDERRKSVADLSPSLGLARENKYVDVNTRSDVPQFDAPIGYENRTCVTATNLEFIAPPCITQTATQTNTAACVNSVQVPMLPPMYHADYQMHSVRNIMEIVPEFDPYDEESLTAKQFADRVTLLRSAYRWDDRLLIHAVQAKLKGAAKCWKDTLPIYWRWADFVSRLLSDFPTTETAADVHMILMKMERRGNESPEEFFHRLCSRGRKGGLADEDIIKYCLRGMREPMMVNSLLGMPFLTINDLLIAIRRFTARSNKTKLLEPRSGKPEMRTKSHNIPNFANNERANNDEKGPMCFNCRERGHISRNCPKEPKKRRCLKCSQTSHRTDQCPGKTEDQYLAVLAVAADDEDVPAVVTKNILLKGQVVRARIDIGSEKSLISQTLGNKLGNIFTDKPVTLKGFAGGTFTATQHIELQMTMDECTTNCRMYLVPDEVLSQEVLLGADVLCSKGNRLIIESRECRMESVEDIDLNTGPINTKERDQLRDLLTTYSDRFAEDWSELGKCTEAELKIQLTKNEPINIRPYRIPFAKREKVNAITQKLLDHGIVRPSTSPYSSPIVLVTREGKDDRLCIDYRALNAITKKQSFPMPVIDEQLALLSGNKFFTTLDLLSGYHQIPIEETSKQYTAFSTMDEHLEYNYMPFGLVNAPAAFQQLVNDKIISRVGPGEALAYMDDIIIPSATIEEGFRRLEKLLQVLRITGLTLRKKKCTFLADEITFLGHEISQHGIKPGSRKTESIREFPIPVNQREVRRFLGLAGYFRKFILDFAMKAKPLTMLLKKDEIFNWTKKQQDAFELLRDELCNEPLLVLYDPTKQHEVHTDASSIGVAGVLMQHQAEGDVRPVFYFSRHCTELESKYHSHELEVLAVVCSLERFRVYLLGKHFTVVTDCAAIQTTKAKKPLNPRISRWWLKLMEFDFEVIHRSSDRLQHADALSRAPVGEAVTPTTVMHEVLQVGVDTADWLVTLQRSDPEIAEVIKILKGELNSPRLTEIGRNYSLMGERLFRMVDGDPKWVVPKAVRGKIVRTAHDDAGHFGEDKVIQKLRKNFWFPRMRRYVKAYVKACLECLYNKRPGGKKEAELYGDDVVPIPFRVLHIDHLGPFPRSRAGHTHVLGIIDSFSRYIVVKAVSSTKTSLVIKALRELTAYFGLPRRIVTDRGSAFTAKSFKDFCAKNGIQHVLNATRTPRANGVIERANQSILQFVRTATTSETEWDRRTRELQWSLNSQQNQTTGCSPNEIVFDFPLRDIISNRILDALQDNADENLNETTDSSEKRREIASRIEAERARWKARFDERHRTPRRYNQGDLVVIEHIPPAKGDSRKLEPKYRGPYYVSDVLDHDRYLITDPPDWQKTQKPFKSVYTAERMKPWVTSSPELDDIDIRDTDEESETDSDVDGRAVNLQSPCRSGLHLEVIDNNENSSCFVNEEEEREFESIWIEEDLSRILLRLDIRC